MARRTDLALEEKELYEESAEKTTELPGVLAREGEREGIPVTLVRILDERGEQALRKPTGDYLTLELSALRRREQDAFQRSARALGEELRRLMALEQGMSVLVAGLGNRAVTPDAVGPKALDHLLITRHLVERAPSYFSEYRPVSAIAPGVLGITGLESAEVIQGVAAQIKPDCMIVIDALAARSLDRVCATVQLTDTGIVPGSGVHNAREAFDCKRFGFPVYAVGVPTVVDVDTLFEDFSLDKEAKASLDCKNGPLIVTPRDVDAQVDQIAKLVAYGVNLALHEGLDVEDIAYFVE